jgi:hypothetical protein
MKEEKVKACCKECAGVLVIQAIGKLEKSKE